MQRTHLWWIQDMDLKWEDLVRRRNLLIKQLQIISSVADGSVTVSIESIYSAWYYSFV